MTTTVTLANMPTVPTDVALNFLDQTKLMLRSSWSSSNGSGWSSEYIYADGDPQVETAVRINVNVTKDGYVRNSIRLTTLETVQNDQGVSPLVKAPIEAVISWNTFGPAEDTAKLLAMIGTAFSLCFNGVTAKVPNTSTINAINRGLVTRLFG